VDGTRLGLISRATWLEMGRRAVLKVLGAGDRLGCLFCFIFLFTYFLGDRVSVCSSGYLGTLSH
jgi:hypothetical protein